MTFLEHTTVHQTMHTQHHAPNHATFRAHTTSRTEPRNLSCTHNIKHRTTPPFMHTQHHITHRTMPPFMHTQHQAPNHATFRATHHAPSHTTFRAHTISRTETRHLSCTHDITHRATAPSLQTEHSEYETTLPITVSSTRCTRTSIDQVRCDNTHYQNHHQNAPAHAGSSTL